MSTITTRAGKGSPLTNTEVDSNFTNLNDDKLENVVEDTTPQLGGDLDTNGNDITFGDSDKAIFGAGSDLQIYHDGQHSYIKDAGTGQIKVLADTNFQILDSTGANFAANFAAGGESQLYHNGDLKIKTTASGIDVTGTVTADGLTVDGEITGPNSNNLTVRSKYSATIDIDSDNNQTDRNFQVIHDGSKLLLKADESGDISFYEDTGTTATFFWDASEEQLSLLGSVSGKVPFRTYSYGYTAEYNSYSAEEGFQVMSYQATSDSPYTKTSDLIANGDGTVPSQMRFLTKANGSSNPTERMRIDSSGNVGIGTDDPSTALDVNGTIKADGLTVDGTLGSLTLSADGARLSMTRANANYIQASSTGGALYFTTNGTTNRQSIDPSGDISFYEDTGTTPKLTWKASTERLGIGTTSPETSLMVEQAGTYTGVHNTAGFKVRNAAATTGVGNPYGAISLSKGTGSAGIAAMGDHATDADMVGLGFYVHSSVTGTDPATEAMRIDSSGNMEMTGGGSIGWANYTFKEESGYLYVYNGSTKIMRVDSSGNAAFAGDVEANATL